MEIPRWAVGLIIAVALIVGVIGLLGFAHANAVGGTRCFIGFAHAQWPKWIGCAMAAHENSAPNEPVRSKIIAINLAYLRKRFALPVWITSIVNYRSLYYRTCSSFARR
jgi:hypothetical protein